jgi:hypothetical protein
MKFNWPSLRSQPLTFLSIFELQQISKRSRSISCNILSSKFRENPLGFDWSFVVRVEETGIMLHNAPTIYVY